MSNKADFGVLYGQKTTEDALLIYSSYEDAKASPQTGDSVDIFPVAIKESEQDYQKSRRHGDHRDHKQLEAVKHGDGQCSN